MIRLLLAAMGLMVVGRIIAENTRQPYVALPKGAMPSAPDGNEWVDVSARLDR